MVKYTSKTRLSRLRGVLYVAYTAVDYYTLTVDRSDCCKAGVEALRLQVVVYPDVNESVKK